MLATLGAIQETVLFYKADRDRPRARRMITEMNPIQQGLDDGFGLGTYAPKRWDRCYNCSPRDVTTDQRECRDTNGNLGNLR